MAGRAKEDGEGSTPAGVAAQSPHAAACMGSLSNATMTLEYTKDSTGDQAEEEVEQMATTTAEVPQHEEEGTATCVADKHEGTATGTARFGAGEEAGSSNQAEEEDVYVLVGTGEALKPSNWSPCKGRLLMIQLAKSGSTQNGRLRPLTVTANNVKHRNDLNGLVCPIHAGHSTPFFFVPSHSDCERGPGSKSALIPSLRPVFTPHTSPSTIRPCNICHTLFDSSAVPSQASLLTNPP